LNVKDTTCQWLLDVLQNEMRNFDLDLFDVWGQSYDNESNMKGKHQSVQKIFLYINSSVFIFLGIVIILIWHCLIWLTFVLKLKIYFRVVQPIYTIFVNSIKRWQILNDHVKTSRKLLSSTQKVI
jgi:hypothetical protein